MIQAEKMPPHNPDAERQVLGSMMRHNPAIGDVVALIRSEDFYIDAHQQIFKTAVGIWEKHKPVDAALIADALQKSGQLENCGSYGYLADLWDCSPTGANAEHYARAVRDRAIQRRLLGVGQSIIASAGSMQGEVQDMLAEAERNVLAIADLGVEGKTVTLTESVDESFHRIDDRHSSGSLELRGIPTGWPDLDEITCGLQDSELVIIAARPSVGKTAFGLNLANHAAIDLNVPTLFVSLEQSRVELTERLLSLRAKVDGHKIRKAILNASDMQSLCTAGDGMRSAPLYFDDSPSQNMLRISANARRLRARKGVRLVVIDYLQLIEPEDRRAPRQEQVSSVSRRLKHLARELKIPVVAMAQVNRQSESRADSRPKLSDLRESGAIEQDADVVMMLHRQEEEGDDKNQAMQKIELNVAKQRNGPTDKVNLMFRRNIMKFESFDSLAHGRF